MVLDAFWNQINHLTSISVKDHTRAPGSALLQPNKLLLLLLLLARPLLWQENGWMSHLSYA